MPGYKSPSGLHKAFKAKSTLHKKRPTLEKKVKAIISKALEHKYVDWYSALGYLIADRVGVVNQVTYNSIAAAGIIQGDGVSQRAGDSITLTSAELRLTMYYDWNAVTAINDQHHIRFILFRWNEPSTTLPTLADILQYVSGGAGQYFMINSPYDHQARRQKDFKILMDKTVSLSSTGTNTVIRRRINLKRSRLEFNQGGVVTGTGHLFLAVLADDATGPHTPAVYWNAMVRTNYIDG